MAASIREIATSIIEGAFKDPTYSANDLIADIYKVVDAASCEIVTYAKVRDFVAAVNTAIVLADGITLNPRYDTIIAVRRAPAFYGKYNTGVYFHFTGTIGSDLMGFEYNTPADTLITFARVMPEQIANSSDFASHPDDFHFNLV